MAKAVFYRGKGAYLVGRLRRGRYTTPLVLALVHGERGVVLDAILFTAGGRLDRLQLHAVLLPRRGRAARASSSRSSPRSCRRSASPSSTSRSASTSTARPSCTARSRGTSRRRGEAFVPARGDKGLVMSVFTLPGPRRRLQGHQGRVQAAEADDAPRGDGQVPARLPPRSRRPARGRAGVRAPRLPGRPLLARGPRASSREECAGSVEIGRAEISREAPLRRAARDAAEPVHPRGGRVDGAPGGARLRPGARRTSPRRTRSRATCSSRTSA